MIDIVLEFGMWGGLVLAASVVGTQYLKKGLKDTCNRWVIMAIPVVLAAAGSSCLAVAGQVSWSMIPLYTFVIGFLGNVLYKIVRTKFK